MQRNNLNATNLLQPALGLNPSDPFQAVNWNYWTWANVKLFTGYKVGTLEMHSIALASIKNSWHISWNALFGLFHIVGQP